MGLFIGVTRFLQCAEQTASRPADAALVVDGDLAFRPILAATAVQILEASWLKGLMLA